jgi:hypothetical protein
MKSSLVGILVLMIGLGFSWPGLAAPEIPALSLPAVRLSSFGKIPELKAFQGTPRLIDSASTLEQAVNGKDVLDYLGVSLTDAQKAFLNSHKFLLIPKHSTRFKGEVAFGFGDMVWDEMLGMFDEISGSYCPEERRPENVHLVTPAVVLHAFHKFFDQALEYIEKEDLAPTLKLFLQGMRDNALQYRLSSPKHLKDRYELLAAQLTVPLVLLDTADWRSLEEQQPMGMEGKYPDSGDNFPVAEENLKRRSDGLSEGILERIKTELKLIYAAESVTPSPLFGGYDKDTTCDFTQFQPRGHYAKSSALRAYFRAMMFLGRNTYSFAADEGVSDAVLLAHLFAGVDASGTVNLDRWKKIMEVTGFFAGAPDDLSYPEWRDFLVQTLGTEVMTPSSLGIPEVVKKVRSHLSELTRPRVLSDVVVNAGIGNRTKEDVLGRTQGFRIIGQRFSLDGWILGRLTAGEEKAEIKLPSTPSAVFIAAVFGSKTARNLVLPILKELDSTFGEADGKTFLGLIDTIAGELARIPDPEWFTSLGGGWLKTLGTLTGEYGQGYPLYMQSSLFGLRQLEEFLGSFTELKHDLLLYSKPNYAECGEGADGEIPPCPKGFVEPNLAFWRELLRLVDYTASGFEHVKLPASARGEYGPLKRFREQVAFFASMAEKELEGKPISEDDYELLRLSDLSYMAQPWGRQDYTDEDRRSALIADVHTDADKGRILYQANGEPFIVLVLVGNENSPRLTIGVTFNHYEFVGPLTARMGDKDWQEKVYNRPGDLPPKNSWYRDLFPQ